MARLGMTYSTKYQSASTATPGTSLEVEPDTATSKYLLPSATAMSRFMYQSGNLKDRPVPASVFILWPYSPKSQADGYAVIAWAHRRRGTPTDGPPSNHIALSEHFLAPFQLATQGYVVVRTEYAGIGVDKHESGEHIVHQYLASTSYANDVVYAIQAAQMYFPELSQDFVVIGHGQGGVATWATAQRHVDKPILGYLGGIAISPVTTLLDQPELYLSLDGSAFLLGLVSTSPDFRSDDVLAEDNQIVHADCIAEGEHIMKPMDRKRACSTIPRYDSQWRQKNYRPSARCSWHE